MSVEPKPLPFIGANPCRIADTRGNGFMGAYGPPSLSQGSPRNFILTGQCSIPASASAVSLNVTVTNTQGPGFVLIYPAGGSQPTVSTLNYVAGQTIANAAVVPLGNGTGGAPVGAITVVAGVSGTDLILDMNGYYSNGVIGDELFSIIGSPPSDPVIDGENLSTASGSSGVRGVADATTGVVYGVLGQTLSLTGGSAGVHGDALQNTGAVYGVEGVSLSSGPDAAGVFGVDTSGPVPGAKGHFGPAGVRGESTKNVAVLGIADSSTGFAGTAGFLVTSGGMGTASGYLATNFGTAGDMTTGPWSVFGFGNVGVTGTKHFVEPHPTDPNGVILYSSLEGREVGTYFRGTARTVGGEATIPVPEDFRIVTDEEGLTTQLTPVGAAATMYIVSEDLNVIVVRSSRDVTFHYLIQGVRRAFKDFQPLAKGHEFMPRSADERMPGYLTEEAKWRLIANGTYNPDGTVNIETAERLGWTKMWADREAASQQPVRKAAPASTR